MSLMTSAPSLAPGDQLRMPDAARYELVDGNLVERNKGMESSEIAAQILGLILIMRVYNERVRTRSLLRSAWRNG